MSEHFDPATPPSLNRRKTICWIMLAASAGATLLFAVLCVLKGPPNWKREGGFYVWPVATVLISILSTISLKRSYRAEPGNFAGFWHLSIVDFYAVTLFTAAAMGIFRAAWPDYFISVGIAVSLALGFAYLFCLLLAARKGYDRDAAKYACALAFLMIAIGWMAVGALGIILAVSIVMGDLSVIFATVRDLLFFNLYQESFPGYGIVQALRFGLIALPFGFLLNQRIGPPPIKSVPES